MDLIDFLRARLDEDEAMATAAGAQSWTTRDTTMGPEVGVGGGNWQSDIAYGVLHCDDPQDGCDDLRRAARAEAEHIARHDPARVLAEVAAKRAMLDRVMTGTHAVSEDCWYTCAAATEDHDGGECCNESRRGTGCDCGLENDQRRMLALLALPYADHPDYREEWRR